MGTKGPGAELGLERQLHLPILSRQDSGQEGPSGPTCSTRSLDRTGLREAEALPPAPSPGYFPSQRETAPGLCFQLPKTRRELC